MSENRKLAIAFALAIIAIGLVGVLKWHYVIDSHEPSTTEMYTLYDPLSLHDSLPLWE